jgi:hypothetical protein
MAAVVEVAGEVVVAGEGAAVGVVVRSRRPHKLKGTPIADFHCI